MEEEIPNNAKIYMLLLCKLPITQLCSKIIYLKKQVEIKEAYDFHINLWNTITSKYFKSFELDEYNCRRIYSYTLDGKYYICEKDKCLDFYNHTKISYQVRDLLMDILSIPYYNNMDMNIINDDYKDYRSSKDIEFGILSKLIMDKCNY